eukprot:TRINITY_DN19809_c0_g1_i1.p1 TRINITY_DN19809_c0_g1~~TRINITY_DN19809_c0_g1_i1.p1  ORF type:complete len:1679 (-),score=364.81 TRINITY_DN19809_c0_g1_i1:165-5201(-)
MDAVADGEKQAAGGDAFGASEAGGRQTAIEEEVLGGGSFGDRTFSGALYFEPEPSDVFADSASANTARMLSAGRAPSFASEGGSPLTVQAAASFGADYSSGWPEDTGAASSWDGGRAPPGAERSSFSGSSGLGARDASKSHGREFATEQGDGEFSVSSSSRHGVWPPAQHYFQQQGQLQSRSRERRQPSHQQSAVQAQENPALASRSLLQGGGSEQDEMMSLSPLGNQQSQTGGVDELVVAVVDTGGGLGTSSQGSASLLSSAGKRETPKQRRARLLKSAVSGLAKLQVRRPLTWVCSGLILVVASVTTGLILLPPDIETDFDTFMKTDVQASTLRDGFRDALKLRSDPGDGRRLSGPLPLYTTLDFELAFEAVDGSDLMTVAQMSAISSFEDGLVDLPEWKELCGQVEEPWRDSCSVGTTMSNHLFPTLKRTGTNVVPQEMQLNGRGRDMVPAATAMRFLLRSNALPVVLPRHQSSAEEAEAALAQGGLKRIRSIFRFTQYCCTAADPLPTQRQKAIAHREKWAEFVRSVVFPYIEEQQKEFATMDDYHRTKPMKIFYGGTEFENIVVFQTLFADSLLAVASAIFVLLYLIMHTQCVVLGCGGLFIVSLAVPLAYIVFAVMVSTQRVSLASFLSLFLIIGLGSDVVFVYTDFWRDSKRYEKELSDRLVWTYMRAGKASLATTATTALSFVANLASVLRPLREFGVFMGLCVMLAWLLVSLIYMPLCLLTEERLGCCSLRYCQAKLPGLQKVLGQGEWRQRQFRRWTGFLSRWKGLFVASGVVATFVFLISGLLSARIDSGVPNLFPEDHNQNGGQKVLSEFVPLREVFPILTNPPKEEVAICGQEDFQLDSSCDLFWCETAEALEYSYDYAEATSAAEEQDEKPVGCSCFRKPTPCPERMPSAATLVIRVAGLGSPVNSAVLEDPLRGYLVETAGEGLEERVRSAAWLQQKPLSQLLLQEWETGDVQVRDFVELRMSVSRDDAPADASCGWEEICFCGAETRSCNMPLQDWSESWFDFGDLTLQPGSRRLPAVQGDHEHDDFLAAEEEEALQGSSAGGGRLLAQAAYSVPSNLRAHVDVVFGIEILPGSPLLGERDPESVWKFLPLFEAAEPWAQRNLYNFCKSARGSADLKVVAGGSRCWIDGFREYVRSHVQERFPVPAERFKELALDFSSTRLIDKKPASEFVWVRDGAIKAVMGMFSVDVDRNSEPSIALAYKGLWDDWVEKYNNEATRYATGAFHCSELWVRAEAQQELIASTGLTLFVVLLLAFIGMLVFTGDGLLSIFVVLVAIGVVSGLIFFITVVAQWPVGPIEVIALIVFIGYAVTYALHVAHKYGSPEALPFLEDPAAELGPTVSTPTAQQTAEGVFHGMAAESPDRGVTGGAVEIHSLTSKPSVPSCASEAPRRDIVRYHRTRYALQSIGGAALGSAVTTLGCSVFLTFCTLTIFQRLGSVVMAVTFLSILGSMGPLPAALLLVGPTRGTKDGQQRTNSGEGRRSSLTTIREIQATLSAEAAKLFAAPGPIDSHGDRRRLSGGEDRLSFSGTDIIGAAGTSTTEFYGDGPAPQGLGVAEVGLEFSFSPRFDTNGMAAAATKVRSGDGVFRGHQHAQNAQMVCAGTFPGVNHNLPTSSAGGALQRGRPTGYASLINSPSTPVPEASNTPRSPVPGAGALRSPRLLI